MKRFQLTFITGTLPALILLVSIQTCRAVSATWTGDMTSDWNFSLSDRTGVENSAATEVNEIIFNSSVSAYTITVPHNGVENIPLVVSGVGITNNSGITQSFVVRGELDFKNSAAIANSVNIEQEGSGYVFFTENASAGNGILTLISGSMEFLNNSTAGNGTFVVDGFTFCGSGSGGIELWHWD